jgi:flagellar biosynthesis anti-sigma factor FlgM
MKIAGTDPATSIQALQAAQQARATSSEDAGPVAKGGLNHRAGLNEAGSLTLSRRAQEVAMALDIARAEPDFRPEVVEQARADLAAGRLTADPNALASMISRDLF